MVGVVVVVVVVMVVVTAVTARRTGPRPEMTVTFWPGRVPPAHAVLTKQNGPCDLLGARKARAGWREGSGGGGHGAARGTR